MEHPNCEILYIHMLAGQALTTFSCPICGKEIIYHNTNVPRVCRDCSRKYHLCTVCGQPIIDNLPTK